tara:strand:+ start:5739 stop:6767 length:1029 start_codon:yes stop_codon:yes gene_type:complete
MLYRGQTVAFSTKSNVWKTRYSFNPTCYMDMDNDFLSSAPEDEQDTNLAWRHDIATAYNNFYGRPYNSIIEVSSNQNPSAVKAFKSLSLESGAQNWRAVVSTNRERGGDPALVQEGTIRSFDSKEGNQYASMPRNSQGSESTSNMSYVGSVRLGDLLPGLEDISDIQNILTPGEIYVNYEVPLQSIPSIPITPSESAKFYIPNPFANGQLYSFVYNIPDDVYQEIFSLQGYNEDAMSVSGYNPENNSIILTTPMLYSTASAQQQSLISLFTVIASLYTGASAEEYDFDALVPIYMMTNPRINGDMMRGPYANIRIVRESQAPFELFSINVDYENTKLDGSLG